MSKPDPLREMKELFAQSPVFRKVQSAIAGGGNLYLSGLWGSSGALLLACLARRVEGVVLAVAGDIDSAQDLHSDLSLLGEAGTELFPQWEILPGEEDDLGSDDIARERLLLTDALAGGRLARGAIVVASIQALVQGAPDPATFARAQQRLERGQTLAMGDLVAFLTDGAFEREDVVESPGAFAVRGGIVDVFAPNAKLPYRVEFFGDEVDSIRLFDHETQESLQRVASCTILARSATQLAARETVPLASLLPAGSVIALVEPMSIAEHGRRYLAAAIDPRGLYRVESILKEAGEGDPAHLYVSTFAERHEEGRSFDFETMAGEDFPREVGKAINELLRRAAESPRLFLCASNIAEETRLRELLREHDLSAPASVRHVVGRISTGFVNREPGFAVAGHHEIFHRHRRRYEPRKPIPARPIDSFLDLDKGDLVVHTTKGIAAYEGLKVIEGPRGTEEYLCLRFAESARLFVPSTQIDMVNKYVGGREKRPTLSKLTGRSWETRKSEAEAATLDLARELLEVQARRELEPGFAYDADTEWQKEFEAAFIYEETPDQIEALDVIKDDVCSTRSMDRLLCGDVGYGKTELAMRTAFKVATAGKQVAVLAPTTLLVEQHFRTFAERMAEYPIEVRALDRFRTGTEGREIIEGLAGGRIDIVVGTHRLVQKDVRFFDLGLLIVDEEQRFGVRHKELLRRFSPVVEVLTMTATPIPRTLHMALLGLRDITTLVTPPQDRLAIETIVCRWDDRRIRTAILRELARNGQVLFVHNRVQTIKRVADRVADIVPEARIVVGHGQMPERELEGAMMAFLGRDADVLVATTIIENGLDIPTANTIFIDRADMFGLADLHQLRGRVGRYRHRAYAYLLLPEDRPVTPVAAKRIRAIADHSELGAGFKIAMRDLEIRGAGNLLGPEQSGHIAAVGYDLYSRLLERSVCRLREKQLAPDIDVTVDLAVHAMLPPDYIPSERMRMEFYRKLATVPTRERLDGVVREMRDRFGEIPIAATRLVAKHAVRLAAAAAGVLSAVRSEDMVVLRCIHPHYVAEMMKGADVVARLVDDRTVVLPLAGAARNNPEALLAHVTGALESAAPPQAHVCRCRTSLDNER